MTTVTVTGTRVIRGAWWSLHVRLRSFVVCSILLGLTLVVACWSIMVGDFPLTVGQVLAAVFGDGGEDAPQLFGRHGAAAEQFDVRLGGESVDLRVDLDGERADDLVGDEPVDAALHGRGGEADLVADLAVSGPCVLAQEVDDPVVEVVHAPG